MVSCEVELLSGGADLLGGGIDANAVSLSHCVECSAYDAVVPARGKALIKTELSVAIPEGTYGRVGEFLPACVV